MFKVKDHYYNKAKDEKYLARSIYKLEEIDQRFKVLKSGDFVVDLGYFPGSWAQYTGPKVGPQGRVFGIDIQPINKKLQLPNATLFEKDIFELKGPEDLGSERAFDVVLSDMAPSTTGIKTVDQARSLDLVESVFNLLPILLRPGGNFVIKVFESQDAQNFLKNQKSRFNEVHYLRPKSTRSVSKEFFVIAKGFKA
ncbi:MAG: RlmE family RNA methyltransferase [Bacteriovoracaceae bacterium]|nr:RlmE family RNA methyltransferase [Bacteriovoracaceae bacterium]